MEARPMTGTQYYVRLARVIRTEIQHSHGIILGTFRDLFTVSAETTQELISIWTQAKPEKTLLKEEWFFEVEARSMIVTQVCVRLA